MKVYFYHTQNLNQIYKKWKEGRFPGHFLYGATHLPKYGVDVVMHKHKDTDSRLQQILYVTWKVLTCKEHFDAIYATHFNGLEFIIFLRALHLYPKPIIIWHHQPIVEADNGFREMMARVFYKGIDHMFFFSDQLIQESLKSKKADEEKMEVCHWGADIDNYDRIMAENKDVEHIGFISTGKEKRDMPTLIRAFSATGQELSIFVAYKACGDNYLEILNDLRPSSNVHLNFIKGLIPNELAVKVWKSKCVVICCQETNYTVGLTTLVEALAFGLPVICTRNATYPIDIEKEGIGIALPYYDSVGWERAIRYIVNNPEEAEEMGRKARKLAEKLYNLENCTREVAEAIKKYDIIPAKPKQQESPVQSSASNAAATEAPQPTDDLFVKPINQTGSQNDRDNVDINSQADQEQQMVSNWQSTVRPKIQTRKSEHEGPSVADEFKSLLISIKDKMPALWERAKQHLPSQEDIIALIQKVKDYINKKL